MKKLERWICRMKTTSIHKLLIKKIFIIILITVCVVLPIGFVAFDFADPPLFWQKEAQQNQKVILEYAKKHYPNAIIVEEKYESNKLNWSANPLDQIIFEQDGVRFAIWANDGEVWGNNFLSAKATQYIENEIILPFWLSRGIDANYSFFIPGEKPVGHVTDYEDVIHIFVSVAYQKDMDCPKDLGWLYDFYTYFRSESNLKNYQVKIDYQISNEVRYLLRFQEDSTFASSEEFYNAFQRIED